MQLTFLGVSSAFTVGYQNFNSNMLLASKSQKNLLIDCGSDIRHSLHEQGLDYSVIDAVFISHLHADHVGGLEWLGFTKYFIENKKPKLYISSLLKDSLWDNVLSGGMSSLESEKASLDTFFDVQVINNDSFVWEGYDFNLVKVLHSINNHKIMPSYGLFAEGDVQKFFITTDTRFSPKELVPYYQKADIIFHDCETSLLCSNQHSRYAELKTLDPAIKAKTWLYDYNDGILPDAVQDGFKGYVVLGQKFSV